jgi:transcription elongation GreA/GreB family factor
MSAMAERHAADPGTPTSGPRVCVGSQVRIWDRYGEVEFVIVPDEAPGCASERHVSMKSALGSALLGHGVGDEVTIRTRAGIHVIRIRDVAIPRQRAGSDRETSA